MDPQQGLTINLGGVQILLPSDVPFTYTPGGSLEIDCSAGSQGKLLVKRAPQRSGTEEPLPESAPAIVEADQHLTDLKNKIILDSQAGQSAAGISWFNQSPRHVQPRSNNAGDSDKDSPEELDRQPSAEVLEGASVSGGSPLPAQQETPEANQRASNEGDAQIDGGSAQAEPTPMVAETPQDEDHSDNPEAPADPTPGAPVIESASKVLEKVERQAGGSDKADQAEGLRQQSTKEADDKENTPAAANRPKKDPKRKSDGKISYPSTGKRSGKKQRAASAQEASGMRFQWRAIKSASETNLPEERWGATLTAARADQAWLFGGDSFGEQLGDIWALDLKSSQWQKLSDHPDQAKAWHQALTITTDQGKQLYAFGGERVAAGRTASQADDDSDVDALSDVCQYDEEAKLWMRLPMTGQKLHRSGHSATLLPDGRILVFGGIDADERHRNDAHIIDLQHLNIFSLSSGIIRGAPPKARAYHSATLVGNSIIVLGGIGARVWSLKEVYSLSIDNWTWKEHTADVEGEAPSPRSGHSAVALPGGRYLLVFGGGIPEQNTFFGTVSVLDTHSWTWSVPAITGVERPRGRSGHGMAVVQTSSGQHVIALHGGRTQEERLCKDTWVLERI